MTESGPITLDIRHARIPHLDIPLLERCTEAVIEASEQSPFREEDLLQEPFRNAYAEMIIRVIYGEIATAGGAIRVTKG